MPLLQDPQLRDLLVVLLTLWPAIIILKRMGLRPAYAGVLFLSVIIPLLGHMMLALYVVSRKWPALPPPVVKKRRS